VEKTKTTNYGKGSISMPMKGKLPPEGKQAVVEAYLSGKKAYSEIIETFKISDITLSEWVRLYQTRGPEGLIPASKYRKYAAELKLQVVTEYLDGKVSLIELCSKYDISSHKIIQDWLKVYSSHGEFKNHNGGGGIHMTEGRGTTFEERVEIVRFCIENGTDYNKAMTQYSVSYQQVYGWVKKYKADGVESLIDRRGKNKAASDMTKPELLKAENKLLESKIKRLEMENELLKKLDEVERRRG
jgi:transposase